MDYVSSRAFGSLAAAAAVAFLVVGRFRLSEIEEGDELTSMSGEWLR